MTAQTAPQYTDRSSDRLTQNDSQLGFTFAPVSWKFIDSDLFRQLSGEAIKLHVYLVRHVDLRVKELAESGRQFIKGQTFVKTYKEIQAQAFPDKSFKSISRYKDQLEDAGLITCQRLPNDGYRYQIKAYQDTKVIKTMESNWRQQRANQTKVSPTNQTTVSPSTIYKKKHIKETIIKEPDNNQLDIPDIITDEIYDNGNSFTQAELVWQEKHQSSARPGGKTVIPAVIESLANSFGVSPEVAEKAWVHAMPNCPESSQGIKISSPNWARTGAMFEGEWFKDGLKKEGWTDNKPNKIGDFSLSFEKLTPENSTGKTGRFRSEKPDFSGIGLRNLSKKRQ
tara:strand:+ start:4053 stop:5069 length:1017 start_codon:yes stop_codon:yes gene_type:complete